MSRVNHPSSLLLLAALVSAGLACASTSNPTVERVQADFRKANSDPAVTQGASVELYEAKQAVERLEAEAEEDDDSGEIDHLAYLAEQRIQIARTAASEDALSKQVEQLGEQRDEMRLRARTAEAELATARADAKSAEADAARLEAERRGQEADAARGELEEARLKAEALEQRFKALKAEETARGLVLTMSDVLFAFDSAELQAGARDALDEVAKFLQEYPERGIEVEGHTDNTGSDEYNRNLSQERARSVARHLEGAGVPSSRMAVRGLGEEKPIAPNNNEAGRQQNRRVEIVIEKPAGVS